ncbi:MAG: hypothetical protein J0M12_14330 [Deltaproteobacteria bacterium]|nr:hypothetical protein [Deltaproteobacteria bacterium]
MKLIPAQSGVFHVFGAVVLVVAVIVFWIFMGWQQHLDKVHAQVEIANQKIETLQVRVKALETKLGM